MLCQSCGKKQATTHIKTITNGELKEYNLCSECAQKLGYGSFFDTMGFDFDKLFGSFMGGVPSLKSARRCECCGSTFEDIAKSGKIGCAECYTTFYNELLPSIQRIHGKTAHTGKLGKAAGEKSRVQNELTRLTNELNEAIKAQNFEKAAELRDKINAIKAEHKDD